MMARMDALRQDIRYCTARDGPRLAWGTTGGGPPLVRAAHFLTHIEYDLVSPVWRPWIAELSAERTLVRYDGRGCGLSDRSQAALDLEAWLADLEAVVDAAGLDRFALFGCSQGCAVSAAYAARHPGRVTALVVVGGYLRGKMRRDPTPAQRKEFQVLLDSIEVGWGRDNPAFRQLFTSLFLPEGTPEQVSWFNELQRETTPTEHALRTIRAFGEIDATDSGARVRCPTLVLHARADAVVPFEEGRHVASTIPGARFVPMESSNHVLLAQEPAFRRCFEEIRGFLAEHDPAPAKAIAFSKLTRGERELVELLARGLDNLQIAAHLGLSEKTVRNKVSAVFDKLAVATRAQAIVRAREAGFGLETSGR